MATTVEFRAQEHFDAFFRHRFAGHSLPHQSIAAGNLCRKRWG
jgi:hypothetical protein